jgi:phosphonate transport system substrate-binding protein
VTHKHLISSLVGIAALLLLLGASSILRSALRSSFAVSSPSPPSPAPANTPGILRIGLIPERDLFAQRKAYQALATYLESKNPSLKRVQLVTTSTYAGILDDFKERGIDAAFAGSLIAILSADRFDAQVLLKSESARPGGKNLSTYTGVIFVRADSPARTLDDLAGKRLAGVRTTMGGAVFPLYTRGRMPQPFDIRWGGTHEDVLREVAEGAVDAGAVKNTRLEAFERDHPGTTFRRLAESGPAPDNALLVRPDLDPATRDLLVRTLQSMSDEPEGQRVLAGLGFRRFLPCTLGEYAPLYAMIDRLGPRWSDLAIDGPAPKPRSSPTQPSTRPSNP